MITRQKRWAKVKARTEALAVDFEGPLDACVVELFGLLELEKQPVVLERLERRLNERRERAAKEVV